jgi:hypothetical protein
MTDIRTYAAFVLVVLLAACGGGGGDDAPPAVSNLAIATSSIDQGNVGKTFFQQFDADGGVQPYTWWISTSGDPLPSGMSLTDDGRLAGIPTEAAARTVVVVVQDSDSDIDLVSLAIEVRDVEIDATAAGVVVPGTSVTFTASGGGGSYQFSLSTNQSGGSISSGGSYVAGNTSGVDVVRAVDQDGFYEEASVTVGQDPFIGFSEQWGTTDVWWINWDVVYDPSPDYSSDFDEVLVALGLRDPSSTSFDGTEADDLARLLVIRRTLGHLSTFYGNGMDGNPQPGGLSISFVGPDGPDGGTTPTVGGILGASPTRYSTICVRYGATSGVVGTAWLDPGNDSIEHNCGDPQNTSLGVFANRILSPYLSAYRNGLNTPVGASDVDGLRALLFGQAPGNNRERSILEVADGYGRTLAAVLAHEIGHSLGLNHSSPAGSAGDIMNASLSVGPSVSYTFNAGHWAELLSSLPGPNR